MRSKAQPDRLADYSGTLTACLALLSAFSGMERENINRGSGWLFMSLGRRLERAIYLTRELRIITTASPHRRLGLPRAPPRSCRQLRDLPHPLLHHPAAARRPRRPHGRRDQSALTRLSSSKPSRRPLQASCPATCPRTSRPCRKPSTALHAPYRSAIDRLSRAGQDSSAATMVSRHLDRSSCGAGRPAAVLVEQSVEPVLQPRPHLADHHGPMREA